MTVLFEPRVLASAPRNSKAVRGLWSQLAAPAFPRNRRRGPSPDESEKRGGRSFQSGFFRSSMNRFMAGESTLPRLWITASFLK